MHLDVEAVQAFRPIQGEARNARGAFEKDRLQAHDSGLIVANFERGSFSVRLAGENESLRKLPILERVVLHEFNFAAQEFGAASGAHSGAAGEGQIKPCARRRIQNALLTGAHGEMADDARRMTTVTSETPAASCGLVADAVA